MAFFSKSFCSAWQHASLSRRWSHSLSVVFLLGGGCTQSEDGFLLDLLLLFYRRLFCVILLGLRVIVVPKGLLLSVFVVQSIDIVIRTSRAVRYWRFDIWLMQSPCESLERTGREAVSLAMAIVLWDRVSVVGLCRRSLTTVPTQSWRLRPPPHRRRSGECAAPSHRSVQWTCKSHTPSHVPVVEQKATVIVCGTESLVGETIDDR